MTTTLPLTNSFQGHRMMSSLDICFDGALSMNIRCELVKELIKYTLYETGQIPMCFDQIKFPHKKQLKQDGKQIKDEEKAKILPPPSRRQVLDSQSKLIESVDLLCETIQSVFSVDGPSTVRKVLLVLGSSLTSPQNSVLVNLPIDDTARDPAEAASLITSLRMMFRAIISEDLLRGVKPTGTSLSTLYVLFLAPRATPLQKRRGLQPCLTFSMASLRGKLYTMNWVCRAKVICDAASDLESSMQKLELTESLAELESDISGWDEAVEISGIVPFSPLHRSVFRVASSMRGLDACVTSKYPLTNDIPTSSVVDSVSGTDSGMADIDSRCPVTPLRKDSVVQTSTPALSALTKDNDDEDFIWYQSSVTVKGYNEKQSKDICNVLGKW